MLQWYERAAARNIRDGVPILVLGDLLIAVRRTAAFRGLRLGQVLAILLVGAVDGLLEDGLRLVDVELGLERRQVVSVAAAVGATPRVGETEVLIDDFLAGIAPVNSEC